MTLDWLKMRKWRACLEPQLGIRCLKCAERLEEETGNDLHSDAYTTQTPKGIVVQHSSDSIVYKSAVFSYVNLMIETECKECGSVNHYPLNYWEEEKVKENNERKSEKEG